MLTGALSFDFFWILYWHDFSWGYLAEFFHSLIRSLDSGSMEWITESLWV